MTAKLTLSVDPHVVSAAKVYAAAAGTWVSKRVEDYLAAIVAGPSSSDVAPVLARLRGTGALLDLRAASSV